MDEKLESASQAVKLTLDTLKSDPAFAFAFDDAAEPLTTEHGVSLLTLKNQALLSYLHNSVVVLLAQVERAATSGADDEEDEEETELQKARNNAIRNTVTQRIVLEKGIKGLESKISYQVEKSIRAYAKSKAAASTKEHSKNDSDDSDSDKDSDKEDDEEEEQDNGDLLLFKPNPKLLLNTNGTKDAKPTSKSRSSKHPKDDNDDEPKKSTEKYQPPKIAATSLSGPASGSSSSNKRQHHNRKNALMEDYLESTSIAPVSEPSIGTTITGGGRGLSTARDRRKEKEIRDYEETNYTRLSSITRKQQEKDKKRRLQRDGGAGGDSFFGEDWGFSSRSNVESATAKRRKDGSVWERAKKRRHR